MAKPFQIYQETYTYIFKNLSETQKKSIARYVVIKLLKSKDKDSILKKPAHLLQGRDNSCGLLVPEPCAIALAMTRQYH